MAASAPGDFDNARLARKILDDAGLSAQRVLKQVGDLFRERRIDLEKRRATRCEHAGEIGGRSPDELESILPRSDGKAWLERELGALADEVLEGVVAQIGQVRDDDVDRVGDRGEQITFA